MIMCCVIVVIFFWDFHSDFKSVKLFLDAEICALIKRGNFTGTQNISTIFFRISRL